MTALADYLGTKPYFMGEKASSLDAAAYAFLANILIAPVDSELKDRARMYPQLESYCQRMKQQFYP